MLAYRTFVLLAVLSYTVALDHKENPEINMPSCSLVSTNTDDYEIYSVPGEVYIVNGPAPKDLTTDKARISPYMKPFYTALPDTATDQITIFGYWDKPDVSFTLVFGGHDDDVAFYLVVDNGQIVIKHHNIDDRIALPEDFAISLNFAFNGVTLRVADLFDEKNPKIAKDWPCLPYRSVPNGISHMAIFTDCVSAKFEMINILFYNQDSEKVESKLIVNHWNLPARRNAVVTMFPTSVNDEIDFLGKSILQPIYTATINGRRQLFHGLKDYFINFDLFECADKFDCYFTWKTPKSSWK